VTDPRDIPLRVAAERQAKKNEKDMHAILLQERVPREQWDSVPGMERTDPNHLMIEIGALTVEENGNRMSVRAKTVVSDMYALGGALDSAHDDLTKSLASFQAKSGEIIGSIRTARMAVTTEIDTAMKSLKDAASFLKAMDEQKGFALLGHLVDLGKQCKDAFGPDGLARLADALLILSEKK